MSKNIKYKRELPIKPTQKPNGADIAAVATAALDIVQHSLLSPSAVVTALACATDLYAKNLEHNGGFDEKTLKQCRDLGAKMAEALLKPPEKPAVLTNDKRLVGADGRPLG